MNDSVNYEINLPERLDYIEEKIAKVKNLYYLALAKHKSSYLLRRLAFMLYKLKRYRRLYLQALEKRNESDSK